MDLWSIPEVSNQIFIKIEREEYQGT
jgi:hypothetical protein